MCFDDFRVITILSDLQIKCFDDDLFIFVTLRLNFSDHEVLNRTSSYEFNDSSFSIERLKMILDFKLSRVIIFETIQRFDVNQRLD